ncbi:DUF1178 family protein [Roseovarius sp. A21]|uniref:DUF1178 family protein n=1 Tax=Roseovarius bejariae TaxID=2576383 RepID=A0A844CV81_9RHOB|nr:DUF1178 family protein [Roseovarius bejariae]MRU14590.1 DUF1178 family protein [Roseovarius bejariae]
MIQFTLKCDKDHRFDSWFQSSDAFDKLKAAGMVACTHCGSTNVDKAMMAPSVQASRGKPEAPGAAAPETAPGPLSTPANPAEQAMTDLRKKIEDNADYVGMNFAREARDIHDGLSPERAIYGEAKPDEARKLIEDGVPVAPLPFVPGRKAN